MPLFLDNIKIAGAQVRMVRFKLRQPYAIAYEEIEQVENLFLRLTTADGLSGYGCAAPDPLVTGETPEDTLRILQSAANGLSGKILNGPLDKILDQIFADLPAKPAARAAVDMALHDLAAKRANKPLYKMLGGEFRPVPTSITLGILPLEETLRQAEARIAEGFRILKIKGGKNPQADLARLRLLRQRLGPDITLRFDANEGYNLEQALAFCQEAAELQLEMIEQPVPRDRIDWLCRLNRESPVPIMADESLLDSRDARRLADAQAVSMFNIKLMKCGGLLEAQRIARTAAGAGIRCMIGCMDESALTIAAALHLMLATPTIVYADLDGHLDLEGDPFAEALSLQNGALLPATAPGLGASPGGKGLFQAG